MKKTLSILLAVITCGFSFAQQASTRGSGTATIQPRIMVIPYTKQGDDIRTILEQNPNLRIVMNSVKENFDSRGFTTVDFTARLKSANTSSAVTTADGAAKDIKSEIIAGSGADMYIEVEIIETKGTGGKSVNLILSAYEASTGNSLANKSAESGMWETDDIAKLAKFAISKIGDDFMTVLQDKFTDIVENGRSLQIEFAINENSAMDMYSEVGSDGLPLSDVIEEWMANNAFNGYYNIQGVSDKSMIFDVVKIPLRDQNSGANYTPTRFAAQVSRMLKGLNLEAERFSQNQKLIFTIK